MMRLVARIYRSPPTGRTLTWTGLAVACLAHVACGAHEGRRPPTELSRRELPHAETLDPSSATSPSTPSAKPRGEAGEPEYPAVLDLPVWYEQAARCAIGAFFEAPDTAEVTRTTLMALGFVPVPAPHWIRRADLLQPEALVASTMPELEFIDAVAVISTFRPHVKDQYIYPTLDSLFAALPQRAIINVLVGSGETDYLRPEMLVHRFGLERAQRIHVMAPPNQVAAFFEESGQTVHAKAGWNYARALRAYHGRRHLLLLEDDIELSSDALTGLSPFYAAKSGDIVVLFNRYCDSVQPTWTSAATRLTLAETRLGHMHGYPTTQAIAYSAQVAAPLAEYLIGRAGREPYDWLSGRYFYARNQSIYFVYPSVVQHRGYQTTGLSGELPVTRCFAPALP